MAHVRMITVALALTVATCGTHTLRKPGSDAAAVGGAGGDALWPIGRDAGMPEVEATADAWPLGGPDVGLSDVGVADMSPQLADFCVGTDSKILYGGASFVVPVTTKTAMPTRQCCATHEVRLHSQDAIGDDLDIVVEAWPQAAAGSHPVGPDSKEVYARLHRSWERPYMQRLMDSELTGAVTLAGALDDPTQAGQLGLCVSLEASSARYPGMLIYVADARVAPDGWASRFRMWRLKDTSLTAQDVSNVDISTVALAAVPLLDLMDIDFVELDSPKCLLGPCTWMGLNTDFQLGTRLRDQIGSPVSLRGVPFVVEADGERIYLGAFESLLSSYAFQGPAVMEEDLSDEGFTIDAPVSVRPAPDLRNDPRIVKVLSESGKIAP